MCSVFELPWGLNPHNFWLYPKQLSPRYRTGVNSNPWKALSIYAVCIQLKEGWRPQISSDSICFSASSGITSSPTMKFDARPTNSTYGNYPGMAMASDPIRAYHTNGWQCRRKADLDSLAFCVLEETTRTTADDLDEDGTERPRLPRAVMDRRTRPGPEPTTLEAVGNQWCYTLLVVMIQLKIQMIKERRQCYKTDQWFVVFWKKYKYHSFSIIRLESGSWFFSTPQLFFCVCVSITTNKPTGCWFVGGDDLTAALHDL